MRSSLEEYQYAVFTAQDISSAKVIIENNLLSLIISDIKMPQSTGLDLLDWTFEKKILTPVILMTGYVEKETVNSAIEKGCFGFLAKPITEEELIKIVANAIGDNKEDKINPNDYARVDIEDFISGKIINFPVYLNLGEGRFVKIAHSGTQIDPYKIEALRAKGVRELFINAGHIDDYIKLNETIVTNKKNLRPDTRHKLIRHIGEMTYEKLRILGVDEASIANATLNLEVMFEHIFKQEDIAMLVSSILKDQNRRSLNASISAMLSCLVAQVMGWSNDKILLNLMLASFLKDICIENEDHMYADPLEMDPMERNSYQEHPTKAVDLLKSTGEFADEVLKTIQQHHEDGSDNAFPNRLMNSKIIPMARIVQVVDFYVCNFMKRGVSHAQGDKIADALYIHFGDVEYVHALCALLRSKGLKSSQKDFRNIMKFGYQSKKSS